jgi:DNA-binding NtrC family response regulator
VSQTFEILALEANDGASRAMEEALRRHNRAYRLTVANNIDAALAILEVRPIQLLLANLHVPGTEGFALLERMRERWPDLPVIVLSGLDTARAAVTALKRGAIDYLVEPIDPRELTTAVDDVARATRAAPEQAGLQALEGVVPDVAHGAPIHSPATAVDRW